MIDECFLNVATAVVVLGLQMYIHVSCNVVE